MGLIKDFKKFRKMKQFEETLALYGLTVKDLQDVVANKNVNYYNPEEVDKIKEEIKKQYSSKTTPEEEMKTFDVDIEDLYTYGKRSETNN